MKVLPLAPLVPLVCLFLAADRAQAQTELFKLVASDGGPQDRLGTSVSLDGTRAVAGAFAEDSFGSNSGAAYVYDVTTGAQLFKLVATDARPEDLFGLSVAVDGDLAVIGAPFADDLGTNAGAAYVFDVTSGTQLFKIVPSDGGAGDNFGLMVALSGSLAIVGSPGDDDRGNSSGAAYVFDLTSGQELHKLTSSDGAAGDAFGLTVAIDGGRAVVGSPGDDDMGSGSGSATIFDVNTAQELFKLLAADGASADQLGMSVDIFGDRVLVGAGGTDDQGNESGSAYLFDIHTGAQLFELQATAGASGDRFGTSVALSAAHAVVGASGDDEVATDAGSVFVFDVNTGAPLLKLTSSTGAAGDQLGGSVTISGSLTVLGASGDDEVDSDAGAALVFGIQAVHDLIKLTASDGAPDDWFGVSVALSGGHAVIGAEFDDQGPLNRGAAYVFDSSSGQQRHKLLASDGGFGDRFGTSVAIDGPRALVGALEDDDMGVDSGAAYLFDVASGAQLFKLTASDGQAADRCGRSVAIHGDLALVGAPGDDDMGTDAGAVYLFDATSGAQLFKFTAPDGQAGDRFGTSVALSSPLGLVGADGDDDLGINSGSAYVLDVAGRAVQFKLTASDGTVNDHFGAHVAIDGPRALVGALEDDDLGLDSGSAYLFDASSGSQLLKLTAPDEAQHDNFGVSVAISGDQAIVGAEFDDHVGLRRGSAYLFDLNDPSAPIKLLPADGETGERFGHAVAIEGGRVLAGAYWDDDLGPNSGSAYLLCTSPLGSNYCGPSTPNSTGKSALIAACGSIVAGDNDLELIATQLPPKKFGYFLASQTQGFIEGPGGSQGNLCLAGKIARFTSQVQKASDSGSFSIRVDLTFIPVSPPQTVMAGDSWSFQAWYRDKTVVTTSNFTDAVSITFE